MSDANGVEAELARAEELHRHGRSGEAVAVLRAVLEGHPGHSRVFEMLDRFESAGGGDGGVPWPTVPASQYRKLSVLGRGGFGEAHLAEDPAGRRVVIKELLLEGMAERFQREAQTLARLSHDGIVRVLQLGRLEGSGRLFYAMEHVDGATLRAAYAVNGVPAIVESCQVLRDVAAAVAYAHGRGVVHRDLKPDNVVVEPSGCGVVIDWGLAGRVGTAGEHDGRVVTPGDLTRGRAGTPFYFGPEQARGERAAPAMDVYALGAMLYERLVGFPPLRDRVGDSGDVRAAAGALRPTPIAERVDPRLRELADLAMACLAFDARERPDAATVAARLEPWATACVCSRCGTVVRRAGSHRVAAGWMCLDCAPLLPADAITAQAVATSAPRRQVTTAAVGDEALVVSHVVETRAGIRSTRAHDTLLDVAVMIEELDDRATSEERARFAEVVEGLDVWPAAAILPQVYRASTTRFVRAQVAGVPLTEHVVSPAFDRVALVTAIRAAVQLGRGLAAVHARGLVLGGIEADELLVTKDGFATNTWRRVRRGGAAEQIADVAALRRCVEWMLARHDPRGCGATCPKAHHSVGVYARLAATVTELRENNPRPHQSADLAKLVHALEAVVQTDRCVACGQLFLVHHLSLGGRGLVCNACSTRIAAHFHVDDRPKPIAGQARPWMWMKLSVAGVAVGMTSMLVHVVPRPAGVAIGLLALLPLVFAVWDLRRRALTPSPPWVVLTAALALAVLVLGFYRAPDKLPADEPSPAARDEEALEPPPALPDPPSTAAAGQKVIDAALAATWGTRTPAKVIRYTGTATSTGARASAVVIAQPPIAYRQRLQLPKRLVDVCWSKDAISMRIDGEPRTIEPAMKDILAFEIQRNPEYLLSHAEALALGPADTIDGRLQDVVAIRSPVSGFEISVDLDHETHVLRRVRTTSGSDEIVENLTDVRDVGGVKIAFRREQTVHGGTAATGGNMTTVLTVDKVELDPDLPANTLACAP